MGQEGTALSTFNRTVHRARICYFVFSGTTEVLCGNMEVLYLILLNICFPVEYLG